MKLELITAACVLATLAACAAVTSNASPGQQALNTTATSCQKIAAAITATDQAVVSGVIKGQAAKDALKGLTAAQAGCNAALAAIESANPGAPK